MSDIPALAHLAEHVKQFDALEEPPNSLDTFESYKARVNKALDGSKKEVAEVKSYIEKIDEKLLELRNAMQNTIKLNQEAMRKILDSMQPAVLTTIKSTEFATVQPPREFDTVQPPREFDTVQPPPEYLEKLRVLREMQEFAKKVMNDRLDDFINETKGVCAKCENGLALTKGDFNNLFGCLRSWENVKEESHKEEERRKEEEKRHREEEERIQKAELERKKIEDEERKKKEEEERRQREEEEAKRKEEEERKRKEEQERRRQEKELQEKKEKERKQREEEERRRREQEEAEQRAEEERKRKEEEERLRIEEELRKQHEENERKRREEEERIRQIEEEKKRREEEAARKREEERQRLEAEEKERQRLKKEAEEKAWRQDPKNWEPYVYTREGSDEIDGQKAFHGGVSCILASPPGGIEEDDLECTASDEIDSIIDILGEEERPISSLIDIKSTKDSLHTEVPSRIYIPHDSALNHGDEIVVKVSINGNDWETTWPVSCTSNVTDLEKKIKRIACVEVNDFTKLRAIVVCRPRCQTINVDKPGVSVFSSMDKNLKIFVPREAYQKKTELRLAVKPVPDNSLKRFVTEIPSLENILSVNTCVTLICQRPSTKCMELDFLKRSQNKSYAKRGKAFHLYTSGDNIWKLADVGYKSHQEDLSVTLPAGRHKYVVIELEVPSNLSKDSVISLVDDLYTCINKTNVRMIVKQLTGDNEKCAVRVVRDDQWQDAAENLAESGYTEGPDISAPFTIQEGQRVHLAVTGNLEATEETGDLMFQSYLGGVKANISLKVKDQWKQKDLPAYVGSIKCCVLGENGSVTRSVDAKVSVPKKLQRERTVIVFTPVRFPYYLTSLAGYVSHTVCKEDGDVWQQVLKTLLGEEEFQSGCRLAKRKLKDDNPEQICKAILLDWMKAQAAHDDKFDLVQKALETNGLHDMASECQSLVNFHKENLNDDVIRGISNGTTKEIRTLGKELDLENCEVDRCIKEHPNNKQEQKFALLTAWRESANVLKHGINALQHLKAVCD